MAWFKRGGFRALAGIVALAALALAPGCDWLKGSDLITRTSPFLGGLSLPGSVPCGEEFLVGFTYDDPQEDVFSVRIVAQHERENRTREAVLLWDDAFDRGSGSAFYPFTFSCDDPDGEWSVSVSVEDDLGHVSNSLSGTVVLSEG